MESYFPLKLQFSLTHIKVYVVQQLHLCSTVLMTESNSSRVPRNIFRSACDTVEAVRSFSSW